MEVVMRTWCQINHDLFIFESLAIGNFLSEHVGVALIATV